MKEHFFFLKQGKSFIATPDVQLVDRLPAGFYTLEFNPMTKQLLFVQGSSVYDKLIDLPGTEYEEVMNEIDTFLKPKTKELFNENGFVYKNSILLHGIPGGGKTCIVNRVSEKVIKAEGVVIFSPDPGLLSAAFGIIDDIQPDTLVMVVLEELDKLIDSYEGELLSLLDGEIQKKNVVFMATTNFLNKIPPRVRRLGRFPTVIEVKAPSSEARQFYLETKMGIKKDISTWVNKTAGFTIDELKEVVRAVVCFRKSFEDSVNKVKENKKLPQVYEEEDKRRYDQRHKMSSLFSREPDDDYN